MTNIYIAVYKCRGIQPIGLPGYNDVLLRLESGNGDASDIIIKCTLSRFVLGRDYLINVSEM